MLTLSSQKSTELNVIILPGHLDFSQDVAALNYKYLIEHLPVDKLLNGFVKIPYATEQISNIIELNEIVVAQCDNQIIGYYLIGGKSKCDSLTYQKLAAERLMKNKAIDKTRIGYGIQVCIDEPFQNNGLFASMLEHLVQNVAVKYDYLVCSVSDENVRSLKIHLKSGWEVFERSGGNNILIYKITTLGV